jgi:hypothetical protein
VADGARSPALARELVLLGAADDDGAAFALRGGKGGADELGREILGVKLIAWQKERELGDIGQS